MYKLIATLCISLVSTVLIPGSVLATVNASTSHIEGKIKRLKIELDEVQMKISQMQTNLGEQALDIQSTTDKVAQLHKDKERANKTYLRLQSTDAEIADIDMSAQVRQAGVRFEKINRNYLTSNKKLAAQKRKQDETNKNINKLQLKAKSVKNRLDKSVNDLVDIRLNSKIKKIETPKRFKARGNATCGEESIKKCQTRAKQNAQSKIIERGSIIDIKTVTEIKDFQLTKDEIRNEVQAKLRDIKVVDSGYSGGGFFFVVEATVIPTINENLRVALRKSVSNDIDAFVKNIKADAPATKTITNTTKPQSPAADSDIQEAQKQRILAEEEKKKLQAKIDAEKLRKQLEKQQNDEIEKRNQEAQERKRLEQERLDKERLAREAEEAKKPKRELFGGGW